VALAKWKEYFSLGLWNCSGMKELGVSPPVEAAADDGTRRDRARCIFGPTTLR